MLGMTTSKRVTSILLVYILFVFIYILLPLHIIASAKTEAETLVRWKNSLLSSSSALDSWSLADITNICNWTGITCNSGRKVSEVNLVGARLTGTLDKLNFSSVPNLVRLSLFNNRLNGSIPSGIGNLSKLGYLALSFNDFDGIIPYELSNLKKLQILYLAGNRLKTPDWSKFKSMPLLRVVDFSINGLTGEIPNFILSCHDLVYLTLYKNNFNGPIPESLFTNLRQPESIALFDNSFEGPLSSNIAKLSKLKWLGLGMNRFSSSIPDAIGSLPSLQFISLENNSLEGKIPSSLGQLKKLEWLILDMNNLNSSIPFELSQCKNLTWLDLSSNTLSGDLPLSLSNLTKLEFLGLHNNQFSGPIPSELGHSKSLQGLNLSNNSFSGNIPSSICNASSLKYLHLSNNKLNSIIPPCMGSGNNNLSVVSLSNNRLEGPIPQALSNCSLPQVLNVENNFINDSFPQWTETLPKLQVLILRSNNFHGSIANSKTKSPFPKLKILDIANNQLTGALPSVYFEHFEAISATWEQALNRTSKQMDSYYYIISIIVLKGQEFNYQQILTVQTAIDLSNNNFHGEIPTSIGKLKFLRSLNLSHNNLTGDIPPSLSNLTNLESLDLSSNQLIGEIPQQLTRLTFLEVLNLSCNHFVGRIPHGGQFPFENDSYIGTTALCGPPLLKMCEHDDQVPQEEEDDDDSNDSDGFEYWDAALMGYGCGMLIGLIIGSLFLSYEKLKWILTANSRKKRRRGIRPL